MRHADDVEADQAALTVGRDGTYLRLGSPQRGPTDQTYVRIPLRIDADALTAAAALELNGWGGWIPGLTGYLDDLAANWKGWEGEKAWRDDSGAVQFTASHNGMNTVALTVSMRPSYGPLFPGTWQADIVVPIEPGVLGDVASQVRSLFRDAHDDG
jgi:hypothetical protein